MNIFVIGISHHKSSVALREKLATLDLACFSADLYQKWGLKEYVFLSTCNRFEFWGTTDDLDILAEKLLEFLALLAQVPLEELAMAIYFKRSHEAVRHVFRVAASLDSLVLGEAQILGQVKDAYRLALKRRTCGPVLSKLMHKCFQAAKRVRAETQVAGGTVSVSSVACRLAQKAVPDLKNQTVLILGAGQMASLATAHFKGECARTIILNRSFDKAEELASEHKVCAERIDQLPALLLEARILVAATGATEAVIKTDFLQDLQAKRQYQPLFIVDIALPRNVEEGAGQIAGVCLKNIDDLKEVVDGNRLLRQKEVVRAEEIIQYELEKFAKWHEGLAVRPTITSLISKGEDARRRELKRTLSLYKFDSEQEKALELMSKALVKRLLHDPLHFIKGGSHPGKLDKSENDAFYLEVIQRAFRLDA